MENMDVINTAVTSLVGVVCCRKQEGGRVIDSCLGMVLSVGASSEVVSCIL